MSPMKRPSPDEKDHDQTLSLAQVCRRLQVSRSQLHRLLAAQKLDFVEIRGHLRVPLTALRRFQKQ